MDDINNDNFDLFDQLSDDKLWDILDNITNEDTDKKTIDVIIDKYNKSCSSCNTKILVFTSSRGSYVCENCGLESQEILDDGPEWSNYDDGEEVVYEIDLMEDCDGVSFIDDWIII